MTWHVEPMMLHAYATQEVDDVHAYSIEAHLLSCDLCRAELAEIAEHDRLESLWKDIARVVSFAEPGLVEKLLLRLGMRDHVTRLLVATPALRVSWFAAVALVLTFAVVAAHANRNGYMLFLVLAPLLPLAGVAVSYGPGVDPTYEIGLAAPIRSFHLLLIRATAVLIASLLLSAIATLALPETNWAITAWLLPSLGLTTAALALSTLIHPLRAATGIALVWVMGSGLAMMYAAQTPVALEDTFGGSLQLIMLSLALVSATLLYGKSDSFETGDR
jgi:hypothetical protein